MTEDELYAQFSEEMDTVATDLDGLLRDPATRRCFDEVVTGEKPLTIDGVLACFGEATETTTQSPTTQARQFSEDEMIRGALLDDGRGSDPLI